MKVDVDVVEELHYRMKADVGAVEVARFHKKAGAEAHHIVAVVK